MDGQGTTGPPRVSGAVVIDQLEAARTLVGPDVVSEALRSLQPDCRAQLEGLTTLSWLEADAVEAAYRAIAQRAGREPLDLHSEMIRIGLKRTLTTVWRALLRFTTDKALMARTPLLYSRSFDRGRLVAHIETPGRALAELTGWPKIPALHVNGVATGMETVLLLAGRKQVSVSHERHPDGVRFFATWAP